MQNTDAWSRFYLFREDSEFVLKGDCLSQYIIKMFNNVDSVIVWIMSQMW